MAVTERQLAGSFSPSWSPDGTPAALERQARLSGLEMPRWIGACSIRRERATLSRSQARTGSSVV